MENKIMMPASYNVLSCEEMTYTEGGATVGQALAAWFWPGYATVIGINTCREARKKDHDNWASNVWNDIKADCKGNVTNAFYHAGMIFWNAASTISSFGISAVMSLGRRAAAFLSNLKKEFCFMTNAITYPAAYNVLSCEEMTYTEGGVGVVEAAMAWFPLYGWYKAVSAIHDYRKANINSNWVENGMNALVAHAEKSPTNTIHDIGCSFWFIGSCATIIGLVPNALLIFGN
ncbi:hypothetical protein [uncultured Faecalibacterium sp.]|nr:hypothetical protein [uncultured Faecalibacterium sp.]SCG97461.1 Uncharacterised protein [uncultured Faecalibacterium sp.]